MEAVSLAKGFAFLFDRTVKCFVGGRLENAFLMVKTEKDPLSPSEESVRDERKGRRSEGSDCWVFFLVFFEAVSSKMFEAAERWMQRSKDGETRLKRRYALVRRETRLRDT